MITRHPTALVILDGFGHSKTFEYNAIAQAHIPTIDMFLKTYPHTLLEASGCAVGLPKGYMGNSEVGHLTIGAGHTVTQSITLINNAIQDKSFFKNNLLMSSLKNLPKTKKLHLMGLLSDAGIHSHIDHLFAFIQVAQQVGITHMVLHLFLDGRDTAPKSACLYLEKLQEYLRIHNLKNTCVIGSIHGRYYAMDRDNNWERTKQSYQALTQKQPIKFHYWQDAINYYYAHNITDEFIPPTQLSDEAIIHDGDGIIFFNYRPDRARQLTQSFLDPQFDKFEHRQLTLSFFITPVNYGTQNSTTVLFYQEPIKNTLKETLNNANKTIFSIAETEKYAHVTYFFCGGKEESLLSEQRTLIPSIRAKNYIEHPEMSASIITDTVLKSLKTTPCDFYLINYANADMVGHSGNFQATIKAIECLDHELKQLFDCIITGMNGTLYITGDHGNAEEKWDFKTNQPRTSHTANPVPFIMIKQGLEHTHKELPLKTLADIAPFILKNLGIPIPETMTKKLIS